MFDRQDLVSEKGGIGVPSEIIVEGVSAISGSPMLGYNC